MKRTQVDIESDEELVVSRRRKHKSPKPPFVMTGIGESNKVGVTMDVFEVIASLPPASIRLFNVMLKRRDVDTNQVILFPGDVPNSRVIGNHFPALSRARLVIRARNGHYLINPDAIIPNDYRNAKYEWNELLKDELETSM